MKLTSAQVAVLEDGEALVIEDTDTRLRFRAWEPVAARAAPRPCGSPALAAPRPSAPRPREQRSRAAARGDGDGGSEDDGAASLALLAEVARAVQALTEEVASLRSQMRSPAPAAPPLRLLSFREAAQALGVSRTRTLPTLLRDHGLKVVTVGGRPKIPADELARVGRGDVAGRKPCAAARRERRASSAPLARDLA